MKRRLITSYLILGILLILFHVVAFVVPSEKTPTFFTAYGFTLAALLAQVGILYLSLGRSRKEELFLKLPALRVGAVSYTHLLGTAITDAQARMLTRYSAGGEVVIAYDSDEAGQKATNKAITLLEAAGAKVRVLRLPDGKDPDERCV